MFRNLSIPVLSRRTSLKQATAWRKQLSILKHKCTLANRQGWMEVTQVCERLRVFKEQVGSPARARHKPVRCASSNWRESLFLILYTYTLNLYLISIPYTLYNIYLILYLFCIASLNQHSPQLLAGSLLLSQSKYQLVGLVAPELSSFTCIQN